MREKGGPLSDALEKQFHDLPRTKPSARLLPLLVLLLVLRNRLCERHSGTTHHDPPPPRRHRCARRHQHVRRSGSALRLVQNQRVGARSRKSVMRDDLKTAMNLMRAADLTNRALVDPKL